MNLVTFDYLLKYYQEYNENTRLLKDNQHKTEFLVTSAYLQIYLRKDLRVLDVGSGPGIYSILCARQGAQVVALDISKKNLVQLKERIRDTPLHENVLVHEGNAVDLSAFADVSFDLVLNMGPLYHLKSLQEK